MTKARDLANIISGGFTADDIPNIDAGKITTGSIADARIPASAVSQHVTSFDDNKIVNDLSTIALRSATTENAIAYNTNSSFVDVFQDSSGIASHLTSSRDANEYVSTNFTGEGLFSSDANTQLLLHSNTTDGSTTFTDSSSTSTITAQGSIAHSTTKNKIGTSSIFFNGSTQNFTIPTANYQFGTGDYTKELWLNTTATAEGYLFMSADSSSTGQRISIQNGLLNWNEQVSNSDSNLASTGAINDGNWHHVAFVRTSTGRKIYIDGVENATKTESARNFNTGNAFLIGRRSSSAYFSGYLDEIRISNSARYTGSFTPNETIEFNDSGNFTGTTITAPTSVSSMGAIITYQDESGTNALNTDIILQLSADNGSTYSTATLTALPNYSTGIKMAKVNDLAVTAGTQLKYKISFANQSSGSKEARIRGVSLQY